LTIDTHHHILPDFFWRETNDSHAPMGGLAPLQWSKQAKISFMDGAGIDVAVMSVSTPGVHFGDSEKAWQEHELLAEADFLSSRKHAVVHYLLVIANTSLVSLSNVRNERVTLSRS